MIPYTKSVHNSRRTEGARYLYTNAVGQSNNVQKKKFLSYYFRFTMSILHVICDDPPRVVPIIQSLEPKICNLQIFM